MFGVYFGRRGRRGRRRSLSMHFRIVGPFFSRWGRSGGLSCFRVASARGGQSALVLQLNDRSQLAQLWALGEQPLVVVGCLPAAYTDRV